MTTSKTRRSVTLRIKKCLFSVDSLPGYPRAMLGYPSYPTRLCLGELGLDFSAPSPNQCPCADPPSAPFLACRRPSPFHHLLFLPRSSHLIVALFILFPTHISRLDLFVLPFAGPFFTLSERPSHSLLAFLSFVSTSPYQETHTVFTPSPNRRLSDFENSIREYHSCIRQHSQRPNKPNQSCI
jgi:hypothetical protein